MLKETIYSPQSIPNGLLPFFKAIFKDFRQGHHLGKQLFIRDTKAQYRQSFLGLFWAFAPAFVTALLWIFLNSSRVISVKVEGMSFAMFTVTGTLLWQTITKSILTTMTSVNSGKSILTKLNFPRESLLINAFYTSGFQILILFVVTCIIALFLGWTPGWSFLYFPLVLLDLMIIGFSISLIFVSIFTLIADFSRFLPIALQLLMYVSAVIFPVPKDAGLARTIFNINPFTHVVLFARNIFAGMPVENTLGFVLVSAGAFLFLGIGLVAYRITMPIIIERMGS